MSEAEAKRPAPLAAPVTTSLADLAGTVQFAEGAQGWGELAGVFSTAPAQHLMPEFDPVTPERSAREFVGRLREASSRLFPCKAGFLAGYLSYDFGRILHGVPSRHPMPFRSPLAWAGVYDWSLLAGQPRFAEDMPASRRKKIEQLLEDAVEVPANTPACQRFRQQDPTHWYEDAFRTLQDYIAAGDCYQANLSHLMTASTQGNIAAGWQRALAPGTPPFSSFMRIPDAALLSFSPEEFIAVRNGQVRTRPIKGTRPRGKTPAEDKRLREELQNSLKDRAENLMIVDLLRNDLGQYCETGSIAVPELFQIETFPAVHHLVSTVTGSLSADCSPIELLAGCMPGGSITGAPKRRAMEIIDELENDARHTYCGTQFVILPDGTLHSSILIRSVLIEDGTAHCRGGGGIVADSYCNEEMEEARNKIAGLLETLSKG